MLARPSRPGRQILTDAGLAAALSVAGQLEVWSGVRLGGIGTAMTGPRGLEALLSLGATAPLLTRRRHPLMAAMGICSALVVQVLFVAAQVSLLAGLLPLLLAVYSAACHGREPVGRGAALLAALGVLALFALRIPEERAAGEMLFGVFVITGAFLAGGGVGARQRWAEAETRRLERRLDEEVEARQEWTRQARAEERAAIARELHDVIAHGVSVMGVQAGAAGVLVGRDPEAARSAVRAIERQARESVGELQRLLGVLRDTDDAGELQPQPGLSQLEVLVGQFRAAGLPVHLDVVGRRPVIPAGVDLAGYRVVQEALTNVLRHAGQVPARVGIRYEPDVLLLDIQDEGPRVGPIRPGHGLIGMRERVMTCGGSLLVETPDGGGVHIRAGIPLDPTR